VASVNIQPLEDKILVQANEAETTTASGIVIPDTAKEKPQEGTVLAVGPGRIDDNGNRVPLDVAEGDVVLDSKYGGTEVKYGGPEYPTLSARAVLAKLSKGRHPPAPGQRSTHGTPRPRTRGAGACSRCGHRAGDPTGSPPGPRRRNTHRRQGLRRTWRSSSASTPRPGPPCSVGSTGWRTRSRSPSARAAGTWCSTRSSAARR
jgi:chaperonin GroES